MVEVLERRAGSFVRVQRDDSYCLFIATMSRYVIRRQHLIFTAHLPPLNTSAATMTSTPDAVHAAARATYATIAIRHVIDEPRCHYLRRELPPPR